MKKVTLILLGLILMNAIVFAQSQYDKYQKEVYDDKGFSMPYRFLQPENISKNKKYPLVILLHGAGERGDDNEKQLVHGAAMFLNPVNREKYPSYVLIPQCPENGYWAYDSRPKSFMPDNMPINHPQTDELNTVENLINEIEQNYQIDKNRIYIVGISMGAMATYDFVSRHPNKFAAAVPICGTVNPKKLTTIKNTAFRIYHGDADSVVPVEGSREAYKQLKKQGVSVEYFELPGVNHPSWNTAFNNLDFMEWLFSQKR